MSSTPNPYSPSPYSEPIPRKTSIRPIQLLQRSFEMIRGEYFLFLGITIVGILIGSVAPFGILLGPMMVGIFLCFSQRQQTGRTEFGTLFKGFDQFLDAFVATLIMVAVSIVVLIPLMFVMFVVLILFAIPAGPNGANELPIGMVFAVLAFVPLIVVANIAVYLPFLFTFQLIADRKVDAVVAVKASAQAAWINIGGLLWYLIATSVIYLLAMLPCYIPALLLLPILVGAMWIMYQDIFETIETTIRDVH